MNTKKMIFLLLTGFMVREVLSHLWLSLEGMLPFTSNVLGITITAQQNNVIIAINLVLTLIFAYFAFSHNWRKRPEGIATHKAV